jgi:hypothetical protein
LAYRGHQAPTIPRHADHIAVWAGFGKSAAGGGGEKKIQFFTAACICIFLTQQQQSFAMTGNTRKVMVFIRASKTRSAARSCQSVHPSTIPRHPPVGELLYLYGLAVFHNLLGVKLFPIMHGDAYIKKVGEDIIFRDGELLYTTNTKQLPKNRPLGYILYRIYPNFRSKIRKRRVSGNYFDTIGIKQLLLPGTFGDIFV